MTTTTGRRGAAARNRAARRALLLAAAGTAAAIAGIAGAVAAMRQIDDAFDVPLDAPAGPLNPTAAARHPLHRRPGAIA